MNKVEKRKVRIKICNILDTHCKGCKKVDSTTPLKECKEKCEHGRTLCKLGKHLDSGKPEKSGRPGSKTKEEWDKLCKKAAVMKFKQGLTYVEIAKKLNITKERLGVQMRARGYNGRNV